MTPSFITVGGCPSEVPGGVRVDQCREGDEEVHVGAVLVFTSAFLQVFVHCCKGMSFTSKAVSLLTDVFYSAGKVGEFHYCFDYV